MGNRPLIYDDFWRVKIVSDVRVSPQGRWAAYVLATQDRESDEARSAIWIANLDTREERQFSAGAARDTQPRWSPDGRWLAFVSTRDGKGQVFVMPSDGGEARRITARGEGAHSPIWAPDSRRIAFVVDTESRRQEVKTECSWLDEKREGREEKPRMRRITEMRYRFDAEGYADTRAHIFVVNRDGGEPEQLTDGDAQHTDPAWSPDGSAIVFVSNRGIDAGRTASTDIWLVDVSSHEVTRLTDGTLTASLPAWSPDGRTIAFHGVSDYSRTGTQNTHVWAVSPRGGDQRDLLPDFDGTMHHLLADYGVPTWSAPIWSPDGQTVYFTSSDHGSEVMCSVASSGGTILRVSASEGHISTAQITPDGSELICCAQTSGSPIDLYRLPVSGGGFQPVTDVNRQLLAEVQITPTERFRYSSVDGCEIDGWLVRPSTGRPCPLVLHIHGGPHSMYGNTFYFNMQVLAGEGIASVYVNPRGSSGYGLAFARSVIGDWGGKPYDDLMAAVDHVLRLGGFDSDRLGVTGVSYGGYMTNWIAGHTGRFAAAISVNGISDLVSFAGTTDIPVWFERQMDGPCWENAESLYRDSPLTYVANVNTPLLFLHAERDFRCPISQSEQMFMALMMLKRETEMVRIPDASHGLGNAPAPRHRIERWRLSTEWFNRAFNNREKGARG